MMITDIIKVFIPATLAFVVGVAMTPFLTQFLYNHKMWKQKAKTVAPDGSATPIFNALHQVRETSVPKMGGIIIWVAPIITILLVFLLSKIFPNATTLKLDFLSRDQTWLPIFVLLVGGLVGLIDDYFEVANIQSYKAGGLSLRKRLLIVGAIGALAGVWFYTKLDVNAIGLPFLPDLYIGWLIIPAFALIAMAVYSGGIIDGLDGLAGGVFVALFFAYTVIAFFQNQINLAAFGATLMGSLLAFLWFNIPPARFYMSETGSMAVTLVLSMMAFMTDSLGEGQGIMVLPIIAFTLLVTTLSVIIQLLSKKFRNGKKVFLVAPLHHHFEAKGWPASKVTMRYWIVAAVTALVGTIVALIG